MRDNRGQSTTESEMDVYVDKGSLEAQKESSQDSSNGVPTSVLSESSSSSQVEGQRQERHDTTGLVE